MASHARRSRSVARVFVARRAYVDAETQSQLEELRRERAAHSRRLGVLREQRAAYGSRNVPPHIVTDIDEANTSIRQIDEAIGKLQAKSFRLEQQRNIFTEFNLLRDEQQQGAEADDRRRRARQRLQDLFYLAVFVMLALILYQVWR
jgi:hypothetical protein